MKRWRDGEMALRWTAGGMLDVEVHDRRDMLFETAAYSLEAQATHRCPPPKTKEIFRDSLTPLVFLEGRIQ